MNVEDGVIAYNPNNLKIKMPLRIMATSSYEMKLRWYHKFKYLNKIPSTEQMYTSIDTSSDKYWEYIQIPISEFLYKNILSRHNIQPPGYQLNMHTIKWIIAQTTY